MANRDDGAAQNGLDADLAELLDVEEAKPAEEPAQPVDPGARGEPDFTTLFGEEKSAEKAPAAEAVDTSRARFPTIVKIQDEPKPFFQDKDYYKKVLAGEGEQATRVHELLGKYMKAEDPEEKSHFRAQLISAYWDLGEKVSLHAGHGLIMPKRLLLRFGILSPGFLTPELRDMVSRIVFENTTGEPVHYVDEWLEKVARGQVRPSAVDEVKQKGAGKNDAQRVHDALEKKRGQRDSELTLLKAKISQLDEREAQLKGQVDLLLRHERNAEHGGLKAPFNAMQKTAVSQVQELLRQLLALDAQVAGSYAELATLDKDLESLGRKSEGVQQGGVDQKDVAGEWGCVRQMAKMACGRQGNHFPIFVSQFVRPNIREIVTRENVIREMAQVEALDPGLFMRSYKNQTTRIVPNIILMASYGDTGICWEPFEKFNRATSRGRIAIPMFPKSLPVAVITAMADLRWQVAKEKAQYYWMEEGLTGKYYQWFSERKLRGDVREYFIRDYALWINKESQGMQKLDKDVRGIFWRMLPFPQNIKDNLRNRGFVYNDLYKKDQNIAKSDGY
ncbi:MAG TPA: hypothetical protein VHE79_06360 [Spirochaetia bacterium]